MAPPATRVTYHYSLDPTNPGPTAKPAAVEPWQPPAFERPPADPAPPEPPRPQVVVKPCGYTDIRNKKLAAGTPAVAVTSHLSGPAVSSGSQQPGTAVGHPSTRQWVPTESSRPPAPPIPKTSTGKAAPAPAPTADPVAPAPAPPNVAAHEPSDTGGTQATEPGGTQAGSRRVGGERRYSEWFAAHPDWRASTRQPPPLDPNQAFRRILDLRNRDRYVGANLANLVTPFHLKGPTGAKESYRVQRVSPLQGREELEDEKARVILSRMAESTQKAYTNQLKWWELFCRRRDLDPIRAVSDQSRASEGEHLLDFVVHSATNVPRSEPTIKTRLAAIRALHVNLGLNDPMASMKGVDLLLQGYTRLRGSPMRRHPAVTPQMLRWIRTGLRPEASLDSAVLWAALLLGFFFLLHASEYLAPEAGEGAAKEIRGVDVVPRLQGSTVRSFPLADEVVLTIRGSKTDQLNEGNVKNHFRAAGELCVIEALQHVQARAPERWYTERHDHLLRWANGKPVRRHEVQAPIMQAAAALGGDPARIGTHSLRIGGASAL